MEPDAEVLSFRVWCLALGYRAAEAEATGLGKLVGENTPGLELGAGI